MQRKKEVTSTHNIGGNKYKGRLTLIQMNGTKQDKDNMKINLYM